ncbi:LOW QUALITY PROTEIN: stomatin-like protein 1 [Phaethornis superciliosus]
MAELGARSDSRTLSFPGSSPGWLSWICHYHFLGFLLKTFPISGWFALKLEEERSLNFPVPDYAHPRAQGMGHVVENGRDPDSPLPQLTPKDGAVISMGTDIHFQVWDPVLSVLLVKDLTAATRMTEQNARTKTLMKKRLHEIQMEKLKTGEQLLVRTAPDSAAQSLPSLQTLGVEVK